MGWWTRARVVELRFSRRDKRLRPAHCSGAVSARINFLNTVSIPIHHTSRPNARDISDCAWNAITTYVQQYVTKAMDAEKIQDLQVTLGGTQDLLKQHIQKIDSLGWKEGSPAFFMELYASIVENDRHFTNAYTPSSPGDVLPVLLPWTAMYVGVAQELYCNSTLYIQGQPSAQDRACNLHNLNATLTKHIQRLSDIASKVTTYEAARYETLDANWPLKSGDACDSFPDHRCGSQGAWTQDCWAGCANTDHCDCFCGNVWVWDRYYGRRSMWNGQTMQHTPIQPNGQAVWQWCQVYFYGNIAHWSAEWLIPAADDSGELTSHSEAVTAARTNFANLVNQHNQHVATGLANSAGKFVDSLKALQTQLATDPIKICGPSSSVNTIPLPPAQCPDYSAYIANLVAAKHP